MTGKSPVAIHVDAAAQRLDLSVDGRVVRSYPVSTGLKGLGEQFGSEQTPRGELSVRIKVGEGAPPGAVFVGRRATGEVYSPALAARFPARDWVLSRILWLTGRQPGINRGGNCDTLRRFIYIHGTPDSEPMGVPASHGCIRMRNADVIDLFDRVDNGTPVTIG